MLSQSLLRWDNDSSPRHEDQQTVKMWPSAVGNQDEVSPIEPFLSPPLSLTKSEGDEREEVDRRHALDDVSTSNDDSQEIMNDRSAHNYNLSPLSAAPSFSLTIEVDHPKAGGDNFYDGEDANHGVRECLSYDDGAMLSSGSNGSGNTEITDPSSTSPNSSTTSPPLPGSHEMITIQSAAPVHSRSKPPLSRAGYKRNARHAMKLSHTSPPNPHHESMSPSGLVIEIPTKKHSEDDDVPEEEYGHSSPLEEEVAVVEPAEPLHQELIMQDIEASEIGAEGGPSQHHGKVPNSTNSANLRKEFIKSIREKARQWELGLEESVMMEVQDCIRREDGKEKVKTRRVNKIVELTKKAFQEGVHMTNINLVEIMKAADVFDEDAHESFISAPQGITIIDVTSVKSMIQLLGVDDRRKMHLIAETISELYFPIEKLNLSWKHLSLRPDLWSSDQTLHFLKYLDFPVSIAKNIALDGECLLNLSEYDIDNDLLVRDAFTKYRLMFYIGILKKLADWDRLQHPLYKDELSCSNVPLDQWNGDHIKYFIEHAFPRSVLEKSNVSCINLGSLSLTSNIKLLYQKWNINDTDSKRQVSNIIQHISSIDNVFITLLESPFFTAKIQVPTGSSSWVSARNINLTAGIKYHLNITLKPLLREINAHNALRDDSATTRLWFRVLSYDEEVSQKSKGRLSCSTATFCNEGLVRHEELIKRRTSNDHFHINWKDSQSKVVLKDMETQISLTTNSSGWFVAGEFKSDAVINDSIPLEFSVDSELVPQRHYRLAMMVSVGRYNASNGQYLPINVKGPWNPWEGSNAFFSVGQSFKLVAQKQINNRKKGKLHRNIELAKTWGNGDEGSHNIKSAEVRNIVSQVKKLQEKSNKKAPPRVPVIVDTIPQVKKQEEVRNMITRKKMSKRTKASPVTVQAKDTNVVVRLSKVNSKALDSYPELNVGVSKASVLCDWEQSTASAMPSINVVSEKKEEEAKSQLSNLQINSGEVGPESATIVSEKNEDSNATTRGEGYETRQRSALAVANNETKCDDIEQRLIDGSRSLPLSDGDWLSKEGDMIVLFSNEVKVAPTVEPITSVASVTVDDSQTKAKMTIYNTDEVSADLNNSPEIHDEPAKSFMVTSAQKALGSVTERLEKITLALRNMRSSSDKINASTAGSSSGSLSSYQNMNELQLAHDLLLEEERALKVIESLDMKELAAIEPSIIKDFERLELAVTNAEKQVNTIEKSVKKKPAPVRKSGPLVTASSPASKVNSKISNTWKVSSASSARSSLVDAVRPITVFSFDHIDEGTLPSTNGVENDVTVQTLLTRRPQSARASQTSQRVLKHIVTPTNTRSRSRVTSTGSGTDLSLEDGIDRVQEAKMRAQRAKEELAKLADDQVAVDASAPILAPSSLGPKRRKSCPPLGTFFNNEGSERETSTSTEDMVRRSTSWAARLAASMNVNKDEEKVMVTVTGTN